MVLGLRAAPDPPREFCSPSAKPRYQMTETDWHCLIHRSGDIDKQQLAKEVNTTIFLAEESLRKSIATDLRSLGSTHPELAAWAETLACRYARGEEAA